MCHRACCLGAIVTFGNDRKAKAKAKEHFTIHVMPFLQIFYGLKP
jgi:hypothetical protein